MSEKVKDRSSPTETYIEDDDIDRIESAASDSEASSESDENVPELPSHTSMKHESVGKILRNTNGEFSLSCGFCEVIIDDYLDMKDHINRHSNSNAVLNTRQPSPEFVSCTMADEKETFREVANTIPAQKSSADGEHVTYTIKMLESEEPRPLKRPAVPKLTIEDLAVSRPCKIQRIDPTTAPKLKPLVLPIKIQPKPTIPVALATNHLKKPPVFPTKISSNPALSTQNLPKLQLPMKIHCDPELLAKTVAKRAKASRSPEWYFGKNYEIIYKNKNSKVTLTASKNLRKSNDNNSDACSTSNDFSILKCAQCKTEPAVSESEPRAHKCKKCEVWFPNHMDYRTHFLQAHRYESPTKCYQCEMEPPVMTETDPRRHKCVICGDWFANHSDFKTHLKDKHDEHVTDRDFSQIANDYKEFTCYICEKTLKQREYLVFHVKSHFEKYFEYQCHRCGLRVQSESVLREHMKRHENTPTKCDLCDKVFPNCVRMRTHRMLHTEELKYKCTVCSKGFKLSKYLSRHMAVHNEVKICCRYCDASFKFSTGRRAHEKSQHNVV